MNQPLTVLYEDNHLLVVEKPPGLATVGVGPTDDSLAKHAKRYLKQKYHKPGNVFLGVVSRLDALVSGVVVFARTSKGAARLAEQFRSGAVQKCYWTIVSGQVEPDQGTLVHWLAKDDAARRVRVVGEHSATGGVEKSRRAELRYRVLGRSGPRTLLEIALLTGRKHQIRVQLAERGWPIVGDKKYGSSQPFAAGIALHSVALSFEHPTTKLPLNFRSSPPAIWKIAQFQ